ncbi:MAG: adenosylcobinamide-GDP ribazoletransferase [Nitrospinae bacterium]|nr:adenosylcobinamide-GDP ribazoletransferase [Nitrospinota bacterium]
MLKPLHLAFTFLTRLPLPQVKQYGAADFGASFAFFPLAGAVIGGIAAAAAYGLMAAGADPRVAAFAALLLLTLVTGALHLDGLADSADGLLSGKGPQRALEIMKEPFTGPFGYTAIFLVLIGKFAALWLLCEQGRFAAIAAALAFSRWSMMVAACNAPYPRATGTGAAFVGKFSAVTILIATATVLAGGFVIDPKKLALFAAVAAGTALALRKFAEKRIGGVTGDILGAVNETAETLLLLVA